MVPADSSGGAAVAAVSRRLRRETSMRTALAASAAAVAAVSRRLRRYKVETNPDNGSSRRSRRCFKETEADLLTGRPLTALEPQSPLFQGD